MVRPSDNKPKLFLRNSEVKYPDVLLASNERSKYNRDMLEYIPGLAKPLEGTYPNFL
jgi:hypothetical protein